MNQKNQHKPQRNCTRRRALVFLAALTSCVVLGSLTFGTWATWTVNRVLRGFDVHAQVEQIRLDLSQDRMLMTGLSWKSLHGETHMEIDTMELSIPFVRDGRWEITSVHIESVLLVVNTSHRISDESTPPFAGDFNSSVLIDNFQWQRLDVKVDEGYTAYIHSSEAREIALNNDRVDVGDFFLGGAEFASPSLPEILHVDSSHCSASWSRAGLVLQSDGLSLPGLFFEGNLTWPMQKSRGRVLLDWDRVQPWLQDTNMRSWLDELGLSNSQTTLTWSSLPGQWEMSAKGPRWFSCQASGADSTWQSRVEFDSIPPVALAVWPANSCHIDIEGSAKHGRFDISGDSTLSALVHANVREPWIKWILDSQTWPKLVLEVSRWGEVINSKEDVLTATLKSDGESVSVVTSQLQSTVPWSVAGHWAQNRVDLRAEAGPAIRSDDTLAMSAEGRVFLLDKGIRWNGHSHSPMTEDTMVWSGSVDWTEIASTWNTSIEGMGVDLSAKGTNNPLAAMNAGAGCLNLQPATWPGIECKGHIDPSQSVLSWVLPSLILEDTAKFHISCRDKEANLSLNIPPCQLSNLSFGPSQLNFKIDSGEAEGRASVHAHLQEGAMPLVLNLNLEGKEQWEARAEMDVQDGRFASLQVVAKPPRADAGWTWGLLETVIPFGDQFVTLKNGPVFFSPNFLSEKDSDILLGDDVGEVTLHLTPMSTSLPTLDIRGNLHSKWASKWLPSFESKNTQIRGQIKWDSSQLLPLSGTLNLEAQDVAWKAIQFSSVRSTAQFKSGNLRAEVAADFPASQTTIRSNASWSVEQFDEVQMDANIENLPLEWCHPWVDTTAAVLSGSLDANLEMSGPWHTPRLSGLGKLDTLVARIPSLGTSFGASGEFDVYSDEVVLKSCLLSDRLGSTARVEGALLHDQFEDWNFDISMVDTPQEMLIMDLPTSSKSPVSGVLVGQGSLDAFFWNNRLELRGDVSAEASTDFKMSLTDGTNESWETWMTFKTTPASGPASSSPVEDELGVLLDLNIQAKPEAKITILTDPKNDANLVGSTQGSIHLTLEDWERLTLKGSLVVVDGRYDFALGSLLRKQFLVEPGGSLFWSGDPYQGRIDLHAKYATRADIQPLLGSTTTGIQNEDIDVILHLNGPMLRPNIAFDIVAPRAPALVSEALTNAILDDSERTRQAIALLSLQEFLPQQINTLELGTTGLQEYSIDIVTSQLSQWLSKINEDIDVGIRYDASSYLNPSSVSQDALQVALKASFFEDKLEVEGAMGSRDVTQAALGDAQLQNVRVLYNLNEEHGIQLAGFSSSQSSATQSGNTTSQGVGIRWHRSFNWTWPWNQSKTTSRDNNESE